MKSRKSLLALAATSTLAGGLLLTSMASATQLIDTAAQQPSSKPITLAEGKCGEGKCGGDSDKEKEGKCGEGKCGGDSDKEKEGKCGEGKCGGGQ